jgi:membrane protein YqaA with SNARE-associated domain
MKLKNLFLAFGFALGAYAAHILMMFSFAWNDDIERCCIEALSKLAPIVSTYSWIPLIGAVLGFVAAALILAVLQRLFKSGAAKKDA